jgi:cytochrome c-type biogenesis protein CcmE
MADAQWVSTLRTCSCERSPAHLGRAAATAVLICVLAVTCGALTGCWVPQQRALALRHSASEVANDPTMAGKPAEVEGRVLPGTWSGSQTNAYFQIADADWAGGRGLEVFSPGKLPDGFRDEAYVVVRGTMDNDLVLQAESVALSAQPPAGAELHASDTSTLRGLAISLQNVDATMPPGMAPGLVTAPVRPSPGDKPLYALLHVRNTKDTTQPVVWHERATLLGASGVAYRVIGAAFHAVGAGEEQGTVAQESGFVDPATHETDRSYTQPQTLGPGGEAYILTVFSVPKGASGLRLQWNPGGAPVEFRLP